MEELLHQRISLSTDYDRQLTYYTQTKHPFLRLSTKTQARKKISSLQ